MDPQVAAAWLTGAVALLVAAIGAGKATVAWVAERRAARKQERIQLRREALFDALEVIDHVYANSSFQGSPSAPHSWDMSLAWRAVNKMILYCDHPAEAVAAFYAAVGVHNPEVQAAPAYGPKQLQVFRRIVAKELELPESSFDDPNLVWIARLPGGVPAAAQAPLNAGPQPPSPGAA